MKNGLAGTYGVEVYVIVRLQYMYCIIQCKIGTTSMSCLYVYLLEHLNIIKTI
jgi:hypothetical protein